MKKFKVLFVMMLCTLLLVGCSTKEEQNNNSKEQNNNSKEQVKIETNGDVYQSNMPAEEKDILKNIDVKFEKAESGQYVMFITNNNTFVIPDLEISVNFYKDGKIVDTAKDGHDAILPGYTVVSDFDSYESFDDAKYDLELDWSNSYKNHSDKVKVDYNINSSKDVLVTVTNNNDYEIEEIEVIVVFYNKDGKLLGTSYAEDIYHVAAGKSKTESLYLKEYSLQNQIDSVKIYINQAHTF